MTDFKKNISNSLIDLITSLNRKICNPAEPIKSFPIPHSHVRVLFYLKKFGSVPISQVAKHLDISRPNMTPIIDKLIAEDLVRRLNDPTDRRIVKVESTDKANELFEKHIEHVKEIISNKIFSLSDEDLLDLDTSILKITSIVNKLD